jgi:hypothetical protein
MAVGLAPTTTSGFPPLAAQAANLSRALWDWAVSGFSGATREEQRRRMNICVLCPEWSDVRCKLCGCLLSAKIRMKTEHCPIGKW